MTYSQIDKPGDASGLTSFELVTLDGLESPVVKQGADYWDVLRGTRRYPSRKEIHPRDLTAIIRNMLLIKVIDGGADFEFRFAGDAQVQAYVVPFQGRRLSQLALGSPVFCCSLRDVFLHVIGSGAPAAVRGNMGLFFSRVKYAYCESMILPLGASDDAVDHLMVFSTYVSRTFAHEAS